MTGIDKFEQSSRMDLHDIRPATLYFIVTWLYLKQIADYIRFTKYAWYG